MTNNVESVTYKIPHDRVITAKVGTEFYLTPFMATGETVKEILIHSGEKALIITDVQAYTVSWWRVIEHKKKTTTGA